MIKGNAPGGKPGAGKTGGRLGKRRALFASTYMIPDITPLVNYGGQAAGERAP